MPRFLCAVHATTGTSAAAALVEQTDGPAYVVRSLHNDASLEDIRDLLASEPQYVAATTVIASGGQRGADALHAVGLSASPVSLTAGGNPTESLQTSLGVLVGTFERVYRDGDVTVPGDVDGASAAVAALYTHADLDAAAADSDRGPSGDLDETNLPAKDGPNEAIIEQSGNAASLSTTVVAGDRPRSGVLTADDGAPSRIAATTTDAAPELGAHADVATALALAVWFGEATRGQMPLTDQADEVQPGR